MSHFRGAPVLGAAVFLILASLWPAQADDAVLKQIGHDGTYILVSPSRVTPSDTPWFLGTAVMMGGSFAADWQVHQDLKPLMSNKSSVDLKNYGDYAQIFGPLAALGFWSWGTFHQDAYTAETGRMAVSSLIWTFLADTGLKFSTGRHRPSSTQDDPFLFTPFRKQGGFVSGHTTNAFASAALFAERYPSWKVALPVYTAATAVGASRLFADQHWTSDVVGGALLGFGISHAIAGRQRKKTNSSSQVFFDGRRLQWVLRFK